MQHTAVGRARWRLPGANAPRHELGYQDQLADRIVLGLALGAMGTLGSTTSITADDGAPTNQAILSSAATQADTALEKYGIVPTLTLRLGFDLI